MNKDMPIIDYSKLEDLNGHIDESDIVLSDYKINDKKETENYYMKMRVGPT